MVAPKLTRNLSAAETVAALRRVSARAGRTVGARDIPPSLVLVSLRHFGSLPRARAAAGLPQPEPRRTWSRQRVLAELGRLHRRGVRICMTDLLELGHQRLCAAATRYAGGLPRARRLLGIPTPGKRTWRRHRWDQDSVIAAIRERAGAGQALAFSKTPARLVNAGQRYFGSWQAAIEAARLDYEHVRLAPRYDDERILERLRRLAARRPDMTVSELGRTFSALLRDRFGSIEEACRRAGIADWPRRQLQPVPARREVLRALELRHRQGKQVHEHAVAADDRRLWYAVWRRFGSWPEALRAAHVPDDSPVSHWSPTLVLDGLRARRASGESLAPAVVRREENKLYNAAIRHFGTYLAAATRLGARPLRTPWDKDRVVRELRALAEAGGPMTTTAAGNHLATACRRHFGSFSAACRAAGLAREYKRHSAARWDV